MGSLKAWHSRDVRVPEVLSIQNSGSMRWLVVLNMYFGVRHTWVFIPWQLTEANARSTVAIFVCPRLF